MTDQELRDLIAENSKGIKELRESQKETDRRMKETDREIRELKSTLKETIKKLDGMGVTQGDISEDMFGDNIEELFEKEGKHILISRF